MDGLRRALEDLDTEKVLQYSRQIKMIAFDPLMVINGALIPAMRNISNAFDEGSLFVPQLLVAADAFEQSIKILTAKMSGSQLKKLKNGKILIYTVEGDIHDVGKNIVNIVFQSNGFEIIDLGRNVNAHKVIDAAQAYDVDMIISFALMTTTLPRQRELIDVLEEKGIRNKYNVIIGGAAASYQWAAKIEADGYAGSISEGIVMTMNLIKEKVEAV
nr:cobalamin-dependent protein [Pectinatus brassicae]